MTTHTNEAVHERLKRGERFRVTHLVDEDNRNHITRSWLATWWVEWCLGMVELVRFFGSGFRVMPRRVETVCFFGPEDGHAKIITAPWFHSYNVGLVCLTVILAARWMVERWS